MSKPWDNYQWGREITVGDGTCGFVVCPLIDKEGDGANAVVADLLLMKKFFGDDAIVDAYVAELKAAHVGRPVGLLALMGEREKRYQNGGKP